MKTLEMLEKLKESQNLIFVDQEGNKIKLNPDGNILMDFDFGWEEECHLNMEDDWKLVPQKISANEALETLRNGGTVKVEVEVEGEKTEKTIEYDKILKNVVVRKYSNMTSHENVEYKYFSKALFHGTWYRVD